MTNTLKLFFLCCDPNLSLQSAVALTLRAVGGLTTREIAQAYLVPEAIMAQRISRAKATVSAASRNTAADDEQVSTQLQAVQHALYLIFNEGYASTLGADLARVDLTNEAIRLARLLVSADPDNYESVGLLALMLLTDARRPARVGESGELIPLTEQDRTLWNHTLIQEGVQLVATVLPQGRAGPYQLQATIAAAHDEASKTEDTDWVDILGLYSVLAEISNSPVVRMNRIIALAMVEGPETALAELAGLEDDARLTHSHRVASTRAHLLEMTGAFAPAAEQFRQAATRTTNQAEQRYLMLRAARLADRVS